MRLIFAGAACALVLLTGCVSTTASQKGIVSSDEALALAKAMTGRFVSKPDEKGNQVEDFRALIIPMGPGQWVYFQRNQRLKLKGQRGVYRQRVLQLVNRSDGRISQFTWSLKAPKSFAGAPRKPELLKSIDRDALVPTLEEGCEQIWQFDAALDTGVWNGIVDPQQCTIFSKRRQKRIGIGSETRLSANWLKEAERGFDLDGTQLWGTPPMEFTQMFRVERK